MFWKNWVILGLILVFGLTGNGLLAQAQEAGVVEETASQAGEEEALLLPDSEFGIRDILLTGEVGSEMGLNFADFVANSATDIVLEEVVIETVPKNIILTLDQEPITSGVRLAPGQALLYEPSEPGQVILQWRGVAGGQLSEPARVIFEISPLPPAPPDFVVNDREISTQEAQPYFLEYGDIETAESTAFRVTYRPEFGVLEFDGRDILPETILLTEIERLVYRPDSDYIGSDSFGYVGINAAGEESVNVGVVVITVEARQPQAPAPSENEVEETENSQPISSDSLPVAEEVNELGDSQEASNLFATTVRVTNPYNYPLENVQVRLKPKNDTALTVGSYQLAGSGVVVQEVDTPEELSVTLARIEPGEEIEIRNIVESTERASEAISERIRLELPNTPDAVVEFGEITPAAEFNSGLTGIREAPVNNRISWRFRSLLGVLLLVIGASTVVLFWQRKLRPKA